MSDLFDYVDRDGDELVISDDVDPSDGLMAFAASQDDGRSVTVYLPRQAATELVDAVTARLMRFGPKPAPARAG